MKRISVFIIFLMTLLFAVAEISPEVQLDYKKYKNYVSLKPNDPDYHFNFAMTLAYIGRVDQAMAEMTKVTKLDKKYTSKSKARLLKKLRKNPNNWKNNFRMGFIYYFLKNDKRAYDFLELVSKKEPVDVINAWAYGYMAVVRGNQNRWTDALKLSKKAIEIEPDGYALRAAYMEALSQNRQTAQASIQLAIALKLKVQQENYEANLFNE